MQMISLFPYLYNSSKKTLSKKQFATTKVIVESKNILLVEGNKKYNANTFI